MESIRIPAASARFQPNPSFDSIKHIWKMHCFGLSENKIICTDNSGLAFLLDAGSRSFVTMPSLHTPKWCPISFSVIGSEQDGASSLYVMEKVPSSDPEAFLYTTSETSYNKSWYRHSLPPPPYILDPGYKRARIHSHAVLGGGSHLCISAIGHGTYCFDTASREWSHAGDWMLPMYGKAEYVPELDIWFGLSDGISSHASVTSPLPSEARSRSCTTSGGTITRQIGTPLGSPKLSAWALAEGDKLLMNDNGSGNTVNGKGTQRIRMVNHMSKLHVLTGYTTIEEVL
ncbi:unnamed protein product [Urochloa decumbens]|uniref:Uncharacterized protein n=1 Tax=Urochloa decumbens TaxID=240449 RepID=A0ABC8Y5I5_9POAL